MAEMVESSPLSGMTADVANVRDSYVMLMIVLPGLV
jgi:hypothetical protein